MGIFQPDVTETRLSEAVAGATWAELQKGFPSSKKSPGAFSHRLAAVHVETGGSIDAEDRFHLKFRRCLPHDSASCLAQWVRFRGIGAQQAWHRFPSTATFSLPIRARKSQVINSKNFKLIIKYGSNAATLWILQITRGKQRVCGSRRRRWSEAVLV